MLNSHEFQQAAKQFRAGRISLKEFTDSVFDGTPTRKPNEQSAREPDGNRESSTSSNRESEIENLALTRLATRPANAHKGDFGRVLLIGGSEGMAGAISLSGIAALRSGSGLVKIAVPEMIQALVATFNPCLMTIGCLSEGDGFHGASENALAHQATWADVLGIGPGMGRGEAQNWIVKKLYDEISQPMVVDADALNALADGKVDLSKHEGQRILTPHPGEFQRIADSQTTNREKLEGEAKSLAQSANVTVVLKGNRTFVTDGSREYRNDTGNPGMATAGSGDVLTGVITSLVGQGLSAFDAAALGVHVHGIAGDFAAESVGETSLIATDIVEFLPAAFKKLAHSNSAPIGF